MALDKDSHHQWCGHSLPRSSPANPGPGRRSLGGHDRDALPSEISGALASLAVRQKQAIQSCLDEWVEEQSRLLLHATVAAMPTRTITTPPTIAVPGATVGDARTKKAWTLDTPTSSKRSSSTSSQVELSFSTVSAAIAAQRGKEKPPPLRASVATVAGQAVSGQRKGSKGKEHRKSQILQVVNEEATCLDRLVDSSAYEWLTAVVIASNALFEGFVTESMSRDMEWRAERGMRLVAAEPPGFVAVQILFWALFSLDLGLRWFADGLLSFPTGPDRSWNILDICVVAFSTFDLVWHFAFTSVSDASVLPNMSVLRVFRIIRIVRVAKVVRVMRFFKELRMMVYSIINALKSLLWTFIVLWLVFYIFGIVFTVAVMDFANTTEKRLAPENAELLARYGTLTKTTLHLFMSMSGGVDWSECYLPLERLSPLFPALFVLFLMFSIFVVSNIVTAVIIETAISTNKGDHEMVVSEEMEAKKDCLSSLRKVFRELDLDGTGSISKEEFEECLTDEHVAAYFHSLKLDVTDAQTLFGILDHDGSKEISIEEFLEGCLSLMGESRALDLKIMQYQLRHCTEAVGKVVGQNKRIMKDLGATQAALGHGRCFEELRQRLGS